MLFLKRDFKKILGLAVLIVLFSSAISVAPTSHLVLEEGFKGTATNNFNAMAKLSDQKNLAPREFTYSFESFDLIINNTVITHSLVVGSYSNVLLVNSVFNVSGFNNIIVRDYGRIVFDNVTFVAPTSVDYPSMDVYALNHSTIVFLNINASITNMNIVLDNPLLNARSKVSIDLLKRASIPGRNTLPINRSVTRGKNSIYKTVR